MHTQPGPTKELPLYLVKEIQRSSLLEYAGLIFSIENQRQKTISLQWFKCQNYRHTQINCPLQTRKDEIAKEPEPEQQIQYVRTAKGHPVAAAVTYVVDQTKN